MTAPIRHESIEKGTGKRWDDWFAFLEANGASQLDHAEIAALAAKELEGTIDSAEWWAQSVAVAFEQAIGRRLPGQRADGTFQTSVSRATSLGMEALFDAWVDFASGDDGIVALIRDEPRTSGTAKRMNWRTRDINRTAITVTSEPKKSGAAAIIVQLVGLPTVEANNEARSTWSEILDRFVARL